MSKFGWCITNQHEKVNKTTGQIKYGHCPGTKIGIFKDVYYCSCHCHSHRNFPDKNSK